MKELIVLGLGANIGDSLLILREAVASLGNFLSDIKCSSVYKTRPRDYTQQSDFFNLVVTGYYSGSPESLLLIIQTIESTYGRCRDSELRFGPRTLDIDIEFLARWFLVVKSLKFHIYECMRGSLFLFLCLSFFLLLPIL